MSDFPKNLAYTLKQLSFFTKQTVKVMPDRTTVNFGEVSRFKLPASALIDFRTLSIFGDVSLYTGGVGTAAANYAYHMPRNGLNSCIQQITITCNGVQLCNINDYNLLYNTLIDLEGADVSQITKRLLENPDPSVYFSQGNTAAALSPIAVTYAVAGDNAANTGEAARPMAINNFLGFISSLSTPVLDLNDCGDIFIEIRWAQPNVCWGTVNAGINSGYIATTNCKIDNLRLTVAKINFENSDYYDLKNQKLTSDGLLVGYYDYFTSRGTAVQKSAGVSMNFNVNTNSLDQCIATFQYSDYNTIKPLVLHGAMAVGAGNTTSFNAALFSSEVSNDETTATIGDYFNNSYYFCRPATDLQYSQWTINSTNIDPYPLPPAEIFNQNLIALGNQNLDFGTGGVHGGCVSLWHFLKYYFAHILSLENLSGDGSHWRSGLSGNGSTINIGYTATFTSKGGTANTETISPVIFCRSTKILTIKSGHLISVV